MKQEPVPVVHGGSESKERKNCYEEAKIKREIELLPWFVLFIFKA